MTKSPDFSIHDAHACAIQSNGKLGKYEYIDNSYGYSPYYSPGLGYGAGQIFPNGDCSFSISIYSDSYGKYTPDTYMGGSEGVMQITDYGDIQFETWLHVSYGSPYASFGGVNRSMHSFVTWIDGDVGYISNTVFDGSYGINALRTSVLYSAKDLREW